jgi:P-type Ca2+ transporter type 2C
MSKVRQPPPALTAIHTAVPGRARLRVPGLRGNTVLKHRIEALLPDEGAIRAATASPVTGNVVVLFDAALPLDSIIDLLKNIAAGQTPSGADRQSEEAWHALPAERVLEALGSGPDGLSADEIQHRSRLHGRNTVPRLPRRSQLAMLIGQLRSGPILVLAAAAALSLVSGGVFDAAVILGVVALNAAIGFATESKTEAIVGALRLPLQDSTLVRRDGVAQAVPVGDVVPGDVLLLRAGVVAAADARLIAADGLSADESMLTGESAPVAKTIAAVGQNRPLAERTSMIYRGTVIAGGTGAAIAVATGQRTEAGRIQQLVGVAQPPQTSLQRQLGVLAGQLAVGCGVVCGFVFASGLLRGNALLRTLQGSIALAVAAVPEGLPTLATTALALGIDEMRRHQVIVRRLDAIENLAAVDVIAFDKTGTLTRNQMSAAAIVCGGHRVEVADNEIDDNGSAAQKRDVKRLLEIGALCSEAELDDDQQVSGSPTEAALVRLAIGAGIGVAELRRQWPMQSISYRSDERQYVKTIHRNAAGDWLVATKGNPEQVLSLCGFRQQNGRRRGLSPTARRAVLRDNRRLAGAGLRVLGLAYAEAASAWDPAAGQETELTWVGLIGLADAARHGVGALLARFATAGVRVIMLTGDQARTAGAIASELGIANGTAFDIVDGESLRAIDDTALPAVVARSNVFARVAPADKLRIVQALQAAGHVVAMTGDGVNDGPAIRAADVGIVMGRSGAEAARDVADIVLQSDDLATIATALERGRATYANIRKAIHYLLATNLSEILVMLTATVLGAAAPLSPIQLLWINLLSDVFPALGLALEPPERDILEEPPRDAHEPLLTNHRMRLLVREGAVIAAGSLAAYGYGRLRYGLSARAGTIAFTSLVGAQLLHALTCRSPAHGLFDTEPLPPNRPLTVAVAASAALQIVILAVPRLRRLMNLSSLGALDIAVGLAGAAAPYLVNEAAKSIRRPSPDNLR